MKILIMGFFACTILAGCSPQLSSSRSSKKVYGGKSLGIPVDLRVSQKKCSKAPLAKYPQSIMVQAGKNVDYSVKFENKSKLISSMEFAGEFHAPTQLALLFHPDIIAHSSTFRLCKLDRAYEHNTYQDATVSILAPIQKFQNNFSEISSSLKLEPVKIRTAPKLKEGDRYLINNAFYYSGTNEITFLPQGYSDKDDKNLPFAGVPFWKFPMVPLHEYGHHIFAQLYKRSNHLILDRNDEEKAESSLCFDNSNEFTESDSRVGEDRLVSKVLAITAINEGFSDVFAYFADPIGRKLIKMGCLAKSRDVESSSFFNNDFKQLNANVLEDFLSSQHKFYAGCSQDTNFQDPHLIGAIFARAFYQLLEEKSISDKKRMTILISWLKEVTKRMADYETPEDILKLAANLFYRVVRSHIGVGKQECITYFEHFPHFGNNRCF